MSQNCRSFVVLRYKDFVIDVLQLKLQMYSLSVVAADNASIALIVLISLSIAVLLKLLTNEFILFTR